MTTSPLRVVLLLVLAGLLAWCSFDWVADQRDTAQSEAKGLREAARISGEMLAARDRIDLKRTEELNDANAQIDALRLDVDAGRQRLSVRAICRPVLSAASGAGGVVDAGTAELAADARQDYFTLRSQLALSKQMILGLQDHIRQVVMRSPATDSTLKPTENTP